MESRLQTVARTVRGTARRAALTVQDLGSAPRQVQRLRTENKQLRHELKVRGWSPQPSERAVATRVERPSAIAAGDGALSEEQREVVDRFHLLYRDGLRLDKKTYWRGARVIKCPLDLWIYQELISELRPDLIVETGTMYGGSAFYFASILDLVGHGE